jgi:hypothetical protein
MVDIAAALAATVRYGGLVQAHGVTPSEAGTHVGFWPQSGLAAGHVAKPD